MGLSQREWTSLFNLIIVYRVTCQDWDKISNACLILFGKLQIWQNWHRMWAALCNCQIEVNKICSIRTEGSPCYHLTLTRVVYIKLWIKFKSNILRRNFHNSKLSLNWAETPPEGEDQRRDWGGLEGLQVLRSQDAEPGEDQQTGKEEKQKSRFCIWRRLCQLVLWVESADRWSTHDAIPLLKCIIIQKAFFIFLKSKAWVPKHYKLI